MRVLIAANPVAGRGRAREAARRVEAALAADGHEILTADTRAAAAPARADDPPAGCDLVLVAGGDGAVRMCAAAVAAAGAALYHLPCGTENLFAREWGMGRDPEALRRAIGAWRIARVDVGRANGQPFLLMASIGFDADVVHHLAARRRGSISHLSYAGPILAQALRWRAPRISLQVDGASVVEGARGMVVVGNSRQYAARINPAPRAEMTDGLLDAVFLPLRSAAALLPLLLRCWTRRHLRARGVVHRRGREAVVAAEEPLRFQIDGDRPEPADPVTRLVTQLSPAALRVLLP